MSQVIKTISLSPAEDKFITDNKISPTRLIRNKLQEMIEFERNGAQNKELIAKVGRMKDTIQAYADFLNKKELIDEFLEEERTN